LKNNAFTPGPWRTGAGACHGIYADRGPASFPIARFEAEPLDGGSASSMEDFANARLASAAPDLLSACEAVLHEWRQFAPTTAAAAITKIEAAIAKARGES